MKEILYRIYDATNNITSDGYYLTIDEAKKALSAYRGQGITIEIFHIDDEYNSIVDFREEDF